MPMRELAAAAALVLYGNLVNLRVRSVLPGASPAHVALGLSAAAIGVGAATAARLTRADLGLARWGRGLAPGLAAAGVLALTIVALARPPLFGGTLRYAPARSASARLVAWHLALSLPLGVALPEEVLFRGVIQGALRRRIGPAGATALAAAAFTLWHVTSVAATLRDLGLASAPTRSAAAAGAAVALFAGGVALGALRELTGSVVPPLLAHWGFNASVLLKLRSWDRSIA